MITSIGKFGDFRYKTRPFKHQEDVLARMAHMPGFGLLWEMGAGKTKPILDNAAQLFLECEIDGLLVISDNGAYRNWVDYEVPIHMTDQFPRRTAAWASSMRSADEWRARQLLVATDDCFDTLVMNVEAFSGKNAGAFAEAFLRSHYAMVVIDESQSIKNIQAKRTQTILGLAGLAAYRRILSGTPMTNTPVDLWSQFEFLLPGCLGFDSFTVFRNFFCKLLQIDLGHGKRYYQVTGYQNLDYLSKRIAPWSSRLLKKDCLDLPEKLYETVSVFHTPEQERVYNELLEEAMSQLETGMVTAVSALVALAKLHQVNCGFVKNDDGIEVAIPHERIKTLARVLEGIDGKVVIWAYHHNSIKEIMAMLEAMPEPYYPVDYYGLTSAEDRKQNIELFMKDPNCRWFVSSQSTGGKGISLVEAHHEIYYSQSFSLMHRLQSEDRCHRPGQHHAVTLIDLVTPGTVDVKIVNALKTKKDLASQVLDLYRDLLAPS